MPQTLLCVQFRNLLPAEDVLLFARTLWGAAQREGFSAFQTRDATLSITKTDSITAPYEAALSLDKGSFQSLARGFDPLETIQAVFAQLTGRGAERSVGVPPGMSETAPLEALGSQADTAPV